MNDRRIREEERRLRAEPRDRADFGQADYSRDYGYDPRRRAGYRAEDDVRPPGADDYGQADYSTDWAYDRERGPYRRFSEEDRAYAERMDTGDYRPADEPPRSWADRASAFFSGGASRERQPRRQGPSDQVLWAVIVERLDDERRLDLRDVEVIVADREVTLNGTVRHKDDKRRIEDVADIEGVRHVQNNLRVRGRDHWTFL